MEGRIAFRTWLLLWVSRVSQLAENGSGSNRSNMYLNICV